MSDAIKHIDVDSDEFFDAPKALRDYAKALQRENQRVTTALGEARGQLTTRALGEVLAGKNFKNPKRVEAALLADKVDPLDTSAVNAWLAENEDDYAKGAAAEATEVQTQQEQPPATPPVSQEVIDGYSNLQVQGAAPAGADKLATVMAKITPDMDGAAVEQLFKEHGI